MTGGYLEMQINRYIIGPIIAFRKYIFSDVVPAFGNINERAKQVPNEYYNRIGSQPAGEDCDIDMADVAEAVQDHPQSWYQMMVSLRQSSCVLACCDDILENRLLPAWSPSHRADRPRRLRVRLNCTVPSERGSP